MKFNLISLASTNLEAILSMPTDRFNQPAIVEQLKIILSRAHPEMLSKLLSPAHRGQTMLDHIVKVCNR